MNYYQFKQILLGSFIGVLYGSTIGRLRRRNNQLKIGYGKSSASFLNKLSSENINYVLLRWTEDIESSRDLDILISDEDLVRLRVLCTRGIFALGKPVDAFSVDGAKGHNFKTIAYFPPVISKRLLEQYELVDGIKRLNIENEFYALLYHILFHKDIFKELDEIFLDKLSNKYKKRVVYLSNQLSANLKNKSVLDMFRMLEINGWETPYDAINKLATYFPVVSQYRDLKICEIGEVRNESCMILREGYPVNEFINILNDLQNDYDFMLGFCSELTAKQIEIVKAKFRGGNWSNLSKTGEEGGGPVFLQFLTLKGNSTADIHYLTRQIKIQVRIRMGGNYVHSTDDVYEAAQLRHMLQI